MSPRNPISSEPMSILALYRDLTHLPFAEIVIYVELPCAVKHVRGGLQTVR